MLAALVAMRTGLLLLIYLWSLLAGSAEVLALPAYCGVHGSGVDHLPAPGSDALELEQVQVVVRHGARTPTAECGRWLPSAGGAVWECSGRVREGVAGERLTFERTFPRGGGALAGTCETGQLLDEGYAQHDALGAALRAAYVGADAAVGRLRPGPVTLRSSDLSRTRQSGEALVSAFLSDSLESFNASASRSDDGLSVETMDFGRDWIYPNVAECPRLAVLERRAYASKDFVAWNATSRALQDRLSSALGRDVDFGFEMAGGHLLDCTLTALCDGRADLLGDLDAHDVDALVAYATDREYFKLRHDDRAYAKTTAAPLRATTRVL